MRVFPSSRPGCDRFETCLRTGLLKLGAMFYAAKCFWPGVSPNQLEEVGNRAGRAARTRRAQGRRAAYLGAVLFPDDDLVLCLFDAGSPAAVKRASEEAGIPCERVMTTVWLAPPQSATVSR